MSTVHFGPIYCSSSLQTLYTPPPPQFTSFFIICTSYWLQLVSPSCSWICLPNSSCLPAKSREEAHDCHCIITQPGDTSAAVWHRYTSSCSLSSNTSWASQSPGRQEDMKLGSSLLHEAVSAWPVWRHFSGSYIRAPANLVIHMELKTDPGD